MVINRFQRNTTKTEVFWCASSRGTSVKYRPDRCLMAVRLSCRSHVFGTLDFIPTSHWGNMQPKHSYRAALHCVRFVACDALSRRALLISIRALVVNKVDFCSAVYPWAPGSCKRDKLLGRLQAVANAITDSFYRPGDQNISVYCPANSNGWWFQSAYTLYDLAYRCH
jgi:hypothetical protein